MSSIALNIKEIPFKYIEHKDIPNFLFYGEMEIADDYYIKNVYSKNNICWVQIPTTDKGSLVYTEKDYTHLYLATCKIKGIAIFTDCKDVAFGKVTEVINKVNNYCLVKYTSIL